MLKSETQAIALSFALCGDDADNVFVFSRLGPTTSDLSFPLDSPVLSELESAWVVSGELECVFCLLKRATILSENSKLDNPIDLDTSWIITCFLTASIMLLSETSPRRIVVSRGDLLPESMGSSLHSENHVCYVCLLRKPNM